MNSLHIILSKKRWITPKPETKKQTQVLNGTVQRSQQKLQIHTSPEKVQDRFKKCYIMLYPIVNKTKNIYQTSSIYTQSLRHLKNLSLSLTKFWRIFRFWWEEFFPSRFTAWNQVSREAKWYQITHKMHFLYQKDVAQINMIRICELDLRVNIFSVELHSLNL